MELSSIFSTSSIYSTSSTSSTSTVSTTSEADNSSASINTDTVSFSLANSGVVSAHQSTGESLMDMSTDDFRDHLKDIVAEMEANGVDVSNYDVDSLSDEDLEALKTEMHEAGAGKGKNGPPPPPKGYEMGAAFTAESFATDSTDNLTQLLLDALESSDEEEETIYSAIADSLYEALQADVTLDETGDLAEFMAANM